MLSGLLIVAAGVILGGSPAQADDESKGLPPEPGAIDSTAVSSDQGGGLEIKKLREHLEADMKTQSDGKTPWDKEKPPFDPGLKFANFCLEKSNPNLTSDLGLTGKNMDILDYVLKKYVSSGLYLISYLEWYFTQALPGYDRKGEMTTTSGRKIEIRTERYVDFLWSNRSVVIYTGYALPSYEKKLKIPHAQRDWTVGDIFLWGADFMDYKDKIQSRRQREVKSDREARERLAEIFGPDSVDMILADEYLRSLYADADVIKKDIKLSCSSKTAFDCEGFLGKIPVKYRHLQEPRSAFLIYWLDHVLQTETKRVGKGREMTVLMPRGLRVMDFAEFISQNRCVVMQEGSDIMGGRHQVWEHFMRTDYDGGVGMYNWLLALGSLGKNDPGVLAGAKTLASYFNREFPCPK